MSKLYNRHFKVGFSATIAAFAFANALVYFTELQQSEAAMFSYPGLSAGPFFRWGFPFNWQGDHVSHPAFGVIGNFLVIVGCGIIVGLVYRRVRGSRSVGK